MSLAYLSNSQELQVPEMLRMGVGVEGVKLDEMTEAGKG